MIFKWANLAFVFNLPRQANQTKSSTLGGTNPRHGFMKVSWEFGLCDFVSSVVKDLTEKWPIFVGAQMYVSLFMVDRHTWSRIACNKFLSVRSLGLKGLV